MHNILVSAYGCEPFIGSESGVGWHWVLEMAKNNRLFVITRANNRDKIEPNVPCNVKENIKFYYYDAPSFFRRLKKKEKGLYFYYTVWQIGIVKIIKKILSEEKIDYTMHLSFGSFWMPTFLPLFRVPFIWGPLGGGDCVPKSFLNALPMRDKLVQTFRYILKSTSFLNPLVVCSAKRAVAILARTEDSATTIPVKYRNKVKVILETAMSEELFNIKRTENDGIVKLIYAGRIIPIKNVMAAVEAVKKVPDNYNIHFTIIGKGSEKNKIVNYINENGLQSRISICEALPRDQVLAKVAESDICIFPSLHEGGSWALMEAMAIGLPVICLDCTGIHTITSEDSAIRIAPNGYEDFVEKTKNAICKLVDEKEFRLAVGKKARKRIQDHFKWSDKGVFMEELLLELEKRTKVR